LNKADTRVQLISCIFLTLRTSTLKASLLCLTQMSIAVLKTKRQTQSPSTTPSIHSCAVNRDSKSTQALWIWSAISKPLAANSIFSLLGLVFCKSWVLKWREGWFYWTNYLIINFSLDRHATVGVSTRKEYAIIWDFCHVILVTAISRWLNSPIEFSTNIFSTNIQNYWNNRMKKAKHWIFRLTC
jgi:hypothetical protein